MRKDEKALRQLFQKDVTEGRYIDAVRKEQAIKRLLEENAIAGAESGNHSKMAYVSCLEQFTMQLKYMDKGAYLLQLLFLLAAVGTNMLLGRENDYFSISKDAYVCVGFSSVAFGTIAAIACRIRDRHGIAELAGSCFFNHRQMCVLRMVLSGAVSLVSMAAVMLVVHRYPGSSLWQFGIYMLVPYFVTGCFLFALLGIRGLRQSPYTLWVGGLLMEAALGAVSSVRGVYETAALGVWILALVLSIAAMAFELAVLFRRIEKGDMLCMN